MRRIGVRIATTIQLNEQQKSELTSIAQSRSLPAGYVFRAKLILLLNEGASRFPPDFRPRGSPRPGRAA